MDRLVAMQVFADVARSASFSATADKLEMSRAMVTRYIGEMEKWLGVRLFQRTTRRVSLTHAGEQALLRCEQIVSLAQDVENEAAPADGVLRGQLRLTCSTSLAYAFLAAVLRDFLALHPQLQIDLNVNDSSLNLVESRVDLAIRISNTPDPGLVARPLTVCESVLVASPGYLAAHGTPQRPEDLTAHECLGYANFGRSLWTLTHSDGEHRTVQVRTRFTANEATVLQQAVLAGAGIAMLPMYLVRKLLGTRQLVNVLASWQPQVLTIHALYTTRRRMATQARALLNYLIERFEGSPFD